MSIDRYFSEQFLLLLVLISVASFFIGFNMELATPENASKEEGYRP